MFDMRGHGIPFMGMALDQSQQAESLAKSQALCCTGRPIAGFNVIALTRRQLPQSCLVLELLE
jgi:hypothetical protein